MPRSARLRSAAAIFAAAAFLLLAGESTAAPTKTTAMADERKPSRDRTADAGTPGTRPTPRPVAPQPAPAANTTWADEFNGAADAPLDSSKWGFDIGGGEWGWGNGELEYYTNSTSNVRQNGKGQLEITARKENPANYQCWNGACQYTSARLITAGKFTQQYGRFEAKIKVPRGQGLWPAFWLLGDNMPSLGWPNAGEIDIMEHVGGRPNTVLGTVHGPGYSGDAGVSGKTNLTTPVADEFHVFAIDWSANLIVWTIDNKEFFRVTPAQCPGAWVFDHPFYIMLNLAVGGHLPGNPDQTTVFPQTMVVDYVRVYKDAKKF